MEWRLAERRVTLPRFLFLNALRVWFRVAQNTLPSANRGLTSGRSQDKDIGRNLDGRDWTE